MIGVVHGDDFVWEGCGDDLDWVLKCAGGGVRAEEPRATWTRPGATCVKSTFSAGSSSTSDKVSHGMETQDTRSWSRIKSGMDDSTKVLNKNGYDEDGQSQHDDYDDDLTTTECKAFRMLAARFKIAWRKTTCGCSSPPRQYAEAWRTRRRTTSRRSSGW